MNDFDTQWTKMMSGEIYDASHPGFYSRLSATRDKLWEFNNIKPSLVDDQQTILRSLLGSYGKNFHFNQPFRCDYGCNIFIGENFSLILIS